jgi:hypothetical protein
MTTDTMEVKSKEYSITYQPTAAIVTCKGSLSLNGTLEYEPMLNLLLQAADQQMQQLTLDLRELTFLNSSGINTFTKFVIQVRKRQNLQLSILGYEEISWQVKLLRNLQRLMPTLEIRMVAQTG